MYNMQPAHAIDSFAVELAIVENRTHTLVKRSSEPYSQAPQRKAGIIGKSA